MHPFPQEFDIIEEKIGMLSTEYFEAYKNETIDGLIYKIYEVDRHLRITVCFTLLKDNLKI